MVSYQLSTFLAVSDRTVEVNKKNSLTKFKFQMITYHDYLVAAQKLHEKGIKLITCLHR